jgi:tripartite-type tricarboxylate transporter receptor subunit TctC
MSSLRDNWKILFSYYRLIVFLWGIRKRKEAEMDTNQAILKVFRSMVYAVLGIFLVISSVGWGAEVKAPKYPAKSIDAVVPFAPGAGTDLMGRVMAEAVSKKWGYPVTVVNKPGGHTIIGANEVMRAAADGYTILVDTLGSSSMQFGTKDLPYKVEERTFMARAAASPMAFVVPYNSPWKTLKDLAEAAKKDPGSLTWTSLGGTSGTDLAMRQFFAAAGIDVPKTKMVTFPGAGPATNAVAGGHVQFSAATGGTILPLVASKNLQCIGVTSSERLKDLPDVPTTPQQGFPSVNAVFWIGFSGPRGLPAHVVRAWAETVSTVLKDPEVIAKLDRITSVAAFLGPEEFKKFVLDEARVIKELIGDKGH